MLCKTYLKIALLLLLKTTNKLDTSSLHFHCYLSKNKKISENIILLLKDTLS